MIAPQYGILHDYRVPNVGPALQLIAFFESEGDARNYIAKYYLTGSVVPVTLDATEYVVDNETVPIVPTADDLAYQLVSAGGQMIWVIKKLRQDLHLGLGLLEARDIVAAAQVRVRREKAAVQGTDPELAELSDAKLAAWLYAKSGSVITAIKELRRQRGLGLAGARFLVTVARDRAAVTSVQS